MKASEGPWPFRPVHITNDGQSSYCDKMYKGTGLVDMCKLNGVGIISNEHLQGIRTRMCAYPQNPTAVVEFSPRAEPVRTGSKVLYFAMHPPCRILTEYTRNMHCLKCDDEQAGFLYGIRQDSLAEELNRRVAESGPVKRYREDEELEFEVRDEQARAFPVCDCPPVAYRGLLLPILFETDVLATLLGSCVLIGSWGKGRK